MADKKSKDKNRDSKSLEKLIKKSRVIRKNIDTIMAAFRRIEKHVDEIQKSASERHTRQQSMSHRLEELMKNVKELDENLKQEKEREN